MWLLPAWTHWTTTCICLYWYMRIIIYGFVIGYEATFLYMVSHWPRHWLSYNVCSVMDQSLEDRKFQHDSMNATSCSSLWPRVVARWLFSWLTERQKMCVLSDQSLSKVSSWYVRARSNTITHTNDELNNFREAIPISDAGVYLLTLQSSTDLLTVFSFSHT